MTSNPAKRITVYEVAELFCKAYDKSAGIETARKGFETSGIWPYDDQKFTEKDFVAAEVTDESLATAVQSVSSEVLQTSDGPVASPSSHQHRQIQPHLHRQQEVSVFVISIF